MEVAARALTLRASALRHCSAPSCHNQCVEVQDESKRERAREGYPDLGNRERRRRYGIRTALVKLSGGRRA
jgi:hypothetical protein